MKKALSLLLAAAFVMSLGAVFAPAASADAALPAVRPEAEIAVRDGYLLGLPFGASAADIASFFVDGVHIIDNSGADRGGADMPATGWNVASGAAHARIVVYGDVNCDAKVNARDALDTMRSIVSGGAFSDEIKLAADVDPDGAVNAADVVRLMRRIVGWDVTLGERFFSVVTDKKTAPAEDAKLALFFTNSLEKFSQKDENNIEVALKNSVDYGREAPKASDFANEHTFEMKLARNEKESCQVQLYAETEHKNLSASLTPFVNGKGETLDGQLLFVEYMKLMETGGTLKGTGEFTGATVPDALPPMPESFSIAAGERQALYIEVSASEDTPAGLYRATLDVTNEAGEVVKTALVYANVWDFTLPVESHVKTAIGMGIWNIVSRMGKNDDKGENGHNLYIQYYEYLLDNRVNAWCLPYNPIDERADRWMDDPRVNTFLVAGGYNGDVYNNGPCGDAVDTETVSLIYDKLKDNETWMKKQMFYMTDEPGIIWVGDEWGGQDKLHQAEAVYNDLLTAFPGARINIPVAKDFLQDLYDAYTTVETGVFHEGGDRWGWGHVDTLDVCARFSNVMCPCIDILTEPALPYEQFNAYADTNYQYTTEHERLYGKMTDRLDAWRAEGKEIWWYTANSPKPPMANIGQRYTGLQNRVMFWEMYKYDIEGFLYWSATEWSAMKRRYLDISAGVIVYAGSDFGTTGFVACQRTGIMRDGIEDVEYLHLAKDLLGDEWVDALVSRVVRTLTDYETDDAAMLAVRNELGDAIEAAMAASPQ